MVPEIVPFRVGCNCGAGHGVSQSKTQNERQEHFQDEHQEKLSRTGILKRTNFDDNNNGKCTKESHEKFKSQRILNIYTVNCFERW